MPELKTKVSKDSVKKFLASLEDPQKRADCAAIALMMEQEAQAKPEMWGASIVGFGRRKFAYANGKEGEWMTIGFAPRAQNIALYGLKAFTMTHGGLVEGDNTFLITLGKYKEGGGCLYIKRLADVDQHELRKVVRLALKRQS